ncbi:hypothetical protein D3C87_1984570 [compost metagenome]
MLKKINTTEYMYKLLVMFICMAKITFMNPFIIADLQFTLHFGYPIIAHIIQIGTGITILPIITHGILTRFIDTEITLVIV